MGKGRGGEEAAAAVCLGLIVIYVGGGLLTKWFGSCQPGECSGDYQKSGDHDWNTRSSGTWCPPDLAISAYDRESEAKSECDADPMCAGVADLGCDEAGWFYTCSSSGVSTRPRASSCVCSGVTSASGSGGGDCIDSTDGWCYTDVGACADGVASRNASSSVAGAEVSVLAHAMPCGTSCMSIKTPKQNEPSDGTGCWWGCECVSCASGHECPDTTMWRKQNCEAVMSKCSNGKYAPAGSSECLSCTPGFFGEHTGQSYCKACEPGQASGSTGAFACTACAAGRYTNLPGKTSCEACAAGKFSRTHSSKCDACPAGRISTAGAAACAVCPAGQYTGSASECVGCPAGMYSALEGALSVGACLQCPPGSVVRGGLLQEEVITGGSTCTACAPGTYSISSEEPCETCDEGSVTNVLNSEGATTCTLCAAGRFSTEPTFACTECSPGHFTAPAGFVSSPGVGVVLGAARCNACPSQSYNAAGDSECETCPAGHYTANASRIGVAAAAPLCEVCPAGKDNPVGDSRCEPVLTVAMGYTYPADASEYASFESMFAEHMATTLGLPKSRVFVLTIDRGSVVIRFVIQGASTSADDQAVAFFNQRFPDPNTVLYFGCRDATCNAANETNIDEDLVVETESECCVQSCSGWHEHTECEDGLTPWVPSNDKAAGDGAVCCSTDLKSIEILLSVAGAVLGVGVIVTGLTLITQTRKKGQYIQDATPALASVIEKLGIQPRARHKLAKALKDEINFPETNVQFYDDITESILRSCVAKAGIDHEQYYRIEEKLTRELREWPLISSPLEPCHSQVFAVIRGMLPTISAMLSILDLVTDCVKTFHTYPNDPYAKDLFVPAVVSLVLSFTIGCIGTIYTVFYGRWTFGPMRGERLIDETVLARGTTKYVAIMLISAGHPEALVLLPWRNKAAAKSSSGHPNVNIAIFCTVAGTVEIIPQLTVDAIYANRIGTHSSIDLSWTVILSIGFSVIDFSVHVLARFAYACIGARGVDDMQSTTSNSTTGTAALTPVVPGTHSTIKSNSSSSSSTGADDDTSAKFYDFLTNEVGLKGAIVEQYATALQQEGYETPELFNSLTIPELREEFKFKRGHLKQVETYRELLNKKRCKCLRRKTNRVESLP
jgi:hypothetical protein